MEPKEDRWTRRRVRLQQWLRRLFKATLWNVLTAVADRAGLTPASVQVLCIDAEAGRLLLLRTREHASGYGPVQGLCRGTVGLGRRSTPLDVRAEARRELLEEALLDAPPLADFWVAERYREGPFAQFDCTVLMVLCRAEALTLRAETSAGEPVWMPLDEALNVLGNPRLKDLLDDWRDDVDATPAARTRRFLLGPAEPVQARAAQATWVPELHQVWPMALGMLASARELGRRDAAAVYQANPDFAAELWRGMSGAARDCYRPDPRLWRDCRLLRSGSIADLVAGWRDARLDLVSARGRAADARSVPGKVTPAVALLVQQRTGAELSLDLIYDSEEDRVGCFVTRGGLGGVMSDVLFYAIMSARYLPIPVFHTHPIFRTPLGFKQPSPADFWLMGSLHYRLDGAPVGDAVFFPDGTWTEYAITGHDHCAFRRAGDPLLPPSGELVTTFADIALPERRRTGAAP